MTSKEITDIADELKTIFPEDCRQDTVYEYEVIDEELHITAMMRLPLLNYIRKGPIIADREKLRSIVGTLTPES